MSRSGKRSPYYWRTKLTQSNRYTILLLGSWSPYYRIIKLTQSNRYTILLSCRRSQYYRRFKLTQSNRYTILLSCRRSPYYRRIKLTQSNSVHAFALKIIEHLQEHIYIYCLVFFLWWVSDIIHTSSIRWAPGLGRSRAHLQLRCRGIQHV